MKIGIECFKDKSIRALIAKSGTMGTCDITDKRGYVYDTEHNHGLEDGFEEILEVFSISLAKQGSIHDRYVRTFLKEWNIFSVDQDDIQKIIIAICNRHYQYNPNLFEKKVTLRGVFSKERLEKYCILKTYTWEEFCHSIKHDNRFHTQLFNFDQFKKLLENMVTDLPAMDTVLFRSRICSKDKFFSGYSKEEMGAPPPVVATAGRSNSEGISCLYLAEDIDTTIHEIRARDYDHVTIASFLPKKTLKIIDFSFFDEISPFSAPDFDVMWFAINIGIITNIANDVASPMKRHDLSIDYVPTQYICDYIKYLGYDGIKYKSTLEKNGINYAIFDQENFECTGVMNASVDKLQYKWDIISEL